MPCSAVSPFAYDPFPAQPASGLEYLRAVTLEVFDELPPHLSGPEVPSAGPYVKELEIPKVSAVELKNVERQKHRPIVNRTAMQSVKIADSVLGQPDNLAIERDGFDAQLEH